MGERLKTGIKLAAVAAAVTLGGFGVGLLGVPWSDTSERAVAVGDVRRAITATDDRATSQRDEGCQNKDRSDTGRTTIEPSSNGV